MKEYLKIILFTYGFTLSPTHCAFYFGIFFFMLILVIFIEPKGNDPKTKPEEAIAFTTYYIDEFTVNKYDN